MPPEYQPFPIYDLRSGLQLDKEPWLLPRDAFSTLTNAFLRDGVLRKRAGYAELVDTENGNSITGIFNLEKVDGSKILCITDTKRLYTYIADVLSDEDGSDQLTGSASQFTSIANWNGKVYMANGKDQNREFDGTTLQDHDADIDGGGNDIDFARFLKVTKNRLVQFATQENGTFYPGRARWSAVNDPDDWTGDEWVDAPTAEWIRGVVPLGDDHIVFFDKSTWIFKYTGDSTLPFRWDKISSKYGGIASFAPFTIDDDNIGTLGKAGLIVSDGIRVRRIDEKVPDLALGFNQETIETCYAIDVEDQRQIYMAYPDQESLVNNRILVFDYTEGAWAIFILPFTALGWGQYDTQESLTWQNVVGSWENYDGIWMENDLQAGYPITLAGKSNGIVYRLNTGTDDDGADIPFEAVSGRWNPYKEKGQSARLGYVDFLVSTNANITMSVDFYVDFESAPYVTRTLDFSPDGTEDKKWIRVYAGAVGASHKLRLSHTASGGTPKIHAVQPYFKPEGDIVG